MRNAGGSITFWAWILSLVLHGAGLAVLGFISFAEREAPAAARPTTITINDIRQLAPVDMPKPKVDYESIKTDYTIPEPPPADYEDKLKLLDEQSKGQDKPGPLLEANPETSALAASGPELSFFGAEAYARKVCFVVDCSGSMKGLLRSVKNQLRSSIAGLAQDQYYYIIFFSGQSLTESGRGSLLRASSRGKNRAYEFIETAEAFGATDPLPAIARALEVRDNSGKGPEVIFFLTDGFDLDNEGSVDFVKTLLAYRRKKAPDAVINTIGFWTGPRDEVTLEYIAEKTGGTFVNVRGRE